MGILQKLFKKHDARFAEHVAVIVKFYADKTDEPGVRSALGSQASCSKCSQEFTMVESVVMEGSNMRFVCPHCRCQMAEIRTM